MNEKIFAAWRRYFPHIAIALFSSIFTISIIFLTGLGPKSNSINNFPEPQTKNIDPIALKVPVEPDTFVNIQRKVSPAVVFIKTSKEVEVQDYVNPFDFF